MIFLLGVFVGAAGNIIGRGQNAVATASEPAGAISHAAASSGHPAEVLRVIDGDTFEARVHLWPGLDITTKVRLRGIDAPELSARGRDESIRAEAARAALRSMLSQGGVTILRVAPDKYGGRVVADAVARGTPDISAALLQGGHARRYGGGRRESWCG